MRELLLLTASLRRYDADPEFVMKFWAIQQTGAAPAFSLVSQELHSAVNQRMLDNGDARVSDIQNKYDQAFSRLCSEFWGHMYPQHDSHFHKSFEEFCNCPFTCLTEIADCVEHIAGKRR